MRVFLLAMLLAGCTLSPEQSDRIIAKWQEDRCEDVGKAVVRVGDETFSVDLLLCFKGDPIRVKPMGTPS